MQVLSALAIGLALVVFSVRMVRSRGFRWWQPLLWLPLAGLIGGAGFMEYYVQRHGDQAVFAYSVMSGCLLAVIFLVLVIRLLGNAPKKANSAGLWHWLNKGQVEIACPFVIPHS